MSESYVSAISVVDLARELKRHNFIDQSHIFELYPRLSEDVCALESGKDISALVEKRYPESWLLQLWRYAEKNAEKPEIGILIGATISPEAHGLLTNWMLHSNTLEEALKTYQSKVGLVNASEHWDIDIREKGLTLTLSFTAGKNYPRCAIERSMVSMHAMGEYLCDRKISLQQVTFTFDKPSYYEQLQQQFQCPMYFSEASNHLVFDADILQWQLPRRNSYLKSMIETRTNELGFLTDADLLQHKVRKLLSSNIALYSQAHKLANALHMSRSTLYRKLKKEGTSFSELLNEQRQRIYRKHRTSAATKLVELLGFHDISAYYKASKRWK